MSPHFLIIGSRRGTLAVALIAVAMLMLGLLPQKASAATGAGPATVATTASNWSAFGYTAQNTGYNTTETKLSTATVGGLALKWQIGPSGGNWAGGLAAVVGGTDYFGLPDGTFYAVSATTGKVHWTYGMGGIGGTPAVAKGVVYIGSADGNFYALNAKTGALIWQYNTQNSSIANSTVTLGGGLAYFEATSPSVLYAVNTTTGALAWSYSNPQGMTPVAFASGHLYLTSDGNMMELAASTGHVKWSTPFGLGGEFSASAPLVSGGSVYGWDMLGSASGAVEAFSATSGAMEWTDTGTWFSDELTLGDGTLYGAYNGEVVAMDPASGLAKWTIASAWAAPNAAGGLEGADGLLFYMTPDGYLAAADASTGTQLWKESSSDPGPVNGWTIADGQVLFGSSDGNMHDFLVPATAAR